MPIIELHPVLKFIAEVALLVFEAIVQLIIVVDLRPGKILV